jgi:beta-lactamase regulating signal transducer with metallopeptidase domain
MIPTFELSSSGTWAGLVFALLHTLWLGVIFALILALVLRIVSTRRPQVRYGAAVLSLAGLVLSWLLAWAVLELDVPPASTPAIHSATTAAVELANDIPMPALQANDLAAAGLHASPAASSAERVWITRLAICWLGGLVVMSFRLVMQFVDLERVRRGSAPVSDSALLALVDELKKHLSVSRPVRIAASQSAWMPSVFGIVYPTVLLPVSMLSGIPTEQLRAIIAHELAHIRRHDYLVNLAQQIVEALLFFNPAVWWINRQIRLEREACCDALAVVASGGRGDYARALTEWVADHRRPGFVGTLLPAFGGENQPSSLMDRLKRLLVPRYQPTVRLPWHSFLGVLAVCGAVLFGVWRGSQFAVVVAAEFLTPQQRIEKIASLHSSHGQETQRQYGEKDQIKLSGMVRTADGSPLPKGAQLHLLIKRPGATIGASVNLTDGRFADKVIEFGKVFLMAQAAGYAPTFLGPLETEPGGNIDPIEIILDKGFSSSLKVVDPEGRPLADAHLKGQDQHPAGFHRLDLTTDKEGLVRIEHCAAIPIRWNVTADGFQYEERPDVRLQPDGVFVWQLQPARPATGIVLDEAGKRPVAGAEVRLIHREPYFKMSYSNLKTAPLLATTDDEGRFSLTTLNHQARYIVVVAAEGFAPKLISDISAGQEGLRIALGPELYIQGKITGDLSLLRTYRKEPVIDIQSTIEIGNSSHSDSTAVPLQVRDKAGHFEARGLRPGKLSIQAGSKTVQLNVQTSISDLVIELDKIEADKPANAIAKAQREILLRLTAPSGLPPAKGEIKLRSWTREDPASKEQVQPIQNNEVRFLAPAPGWIGFEARGLVGNWIPDENAIEIPTGSEPFVIERAAIPAGAIFGNVTGHDGSDVAGVLVSVVEVKKAPQKKVPAGLSAQGKSSASEGDGPTRFMAQPLPLGGTYMLVAHRGLSYVTSPAIALTEAEPIREINLRLARGIDLEGDVTDAAGAGLEGIVVHLDYSTPFSHGFGSDQGAVTDGKGHFLFSGINSEAMGNYSFSVKGQKGFRPLKEQVEFNRGPAKLILRKGESLTGVVLNHASGHPLSGVELYAIPVNPKPGDSASFLDPDSKTNERGEFRFTNLERRDYWLGCRSGTIQNAANGRIRIRGGQTAPMTIRMQPYLGARLWEQGKPIAAQKQ